MLRDKAKYNEQVKEYVRLHANKELWERRKQVSNCDEKSPLLSGGKEDCFGARRKFATGPAPAVPPNGVFGNGFQIGEAPRSDDNDGQLEEDDLLDDDDGL
eukprot:CAMPEP_0113859458 /NCGR_PEP_ID=MMETSP0372-20130328/12384_1 /TAXON_ID=340204 /ORGANISM="Lankesteria abbotti" /LENGTH=100 /DNA_ID=CAMNT_0000837735 /DNA_START=509 /DNA_END=811 /DNA_ORIENTATION=- /assembly_acc=CAM_ASM_000359